MRTILITLLIALNFKCSLNPIELTHTPIVEKENYIKFNKSSIEKQKVKLGKNIYVFNKWKKLNKLDSILFFKELLRDSIMVKLKFDSAYYLSYQSLNLLNYCQDNLILVLSFSSKKDVDFLYRYLNSNILDYAPFEYLAQITRSNTELIFFLINNEDCVRQNKSFSFQLKCYINSLLVCDSLDRDNYFNQGCISYKKDSTSILDPY